jgi:hypothetical protein
MLEADRRQLYWLEPTGVPVVDSGLEIGCSPPKFSMFFFRRVRPKEDVMQVIETYWEKPVTVRLQSGLDRTFYSLEDSLEILENEWPTKFGVHHRRALDLCRAAAKRMVATEAAREAFIAACLEASMPLVINVAKAPVARGHSAQP